jgi:FkbM family methyltransferase
VGRILAEAGMRPIEVKMNNVNGGSFAVTSVRRGERRSKTASAPHCMRSRLVADSISDLTSRSGHNVVEGNVDALVRAQFFPDAAFKGVMVEVGAARPDFLSIGASFRDLGWRVLSIEPNPVFAMMHRELGHEVVQAACGEHDADDVPFFVVDSNQASYLGGSVTFESFSSLGVRGGYAKVMSSVDVRTTEIRVAVRRLDSVLDAASPNIERVDLVCVDVEGWELEVLAGLSFERWQPKVVIAEHLFEGPEYQEFMRKRGYELWRCMAPNEIYVQTTEAPFIP